MDLNLSGKRALVCGSSRGMGKSIAKELASSGASVTLLARDAEVLENVARELDGEGHDYLVADFDHLTRVEKAVAQGLTKGPFHILINNTGGPAPGPLAEAQLDQFTRAMERHLHVSHKLTQMLMPGMKKAQFGRIINIISTSVRIPIPNLGVSNTVRGAMASWSKTLANELGPFGITVNNILPGFIDTERLQSLIRNKASTANQTTEQVAEEMRQSIPAGRFGTPEEVAAYAAFICSRSGGYINGTSLRIDGGRTGSI